MSRRIARWMLLLAVISLTLAPVGRALADASPPEPPKGTSIESGYEGTKVQMVSENVLMTIQDDQAVVEATFQMRNQGTAPESMDVRFPIGQNDGWGKFNEVQGFTAYVDGKLAEVKIVDQGYGDTTIPWGTWTVTFPPGQTVTLGVTYLVPPNPNFSPSFVSYPYILETGAGWFGPIGEGTITARLPYEINEFNTRFSSYTPAPEYHKVSGTDVVWHFSDLEPTRNDNIWLWLMRPTVWRALQSAEAGVKQSPDSLDAHIALARALAASMDIDLKHGMRDDSGTELDVFNRSVAEYEYVLTRAPDVPEFNNEFVHLLDLYPSDLSKECPAYRKALTIPGHDPEFDEWTNTASQCAEADTATITALTPAPTTTHGPKASDTLTPHAPTPTARPVVTPTTAGPSASSGPVSMIGIIVGAVALLALGVGAWLYYRAKSGGVIDAPE